jgi:hypothetical protein
VGRAMGTGICFLLARSSPLPLSLSDEPERLRFLESFFQGLTLVPFSTQLELSLPSSAHFKLTLSPT